MKNQKCWLVFASLLVLGVGFAVPIQLRTVPGSVSVYINGVLFGISDRMGVVSDLLFLSPGHHRLTAEKPGFERLDAVYHIQEATSVTLSLKPAGVLRIVATPQEAEIFVQGELWGQGAAERTLPIGKYLVEARLSGYLTRSFYVEVQQYFTRELLIDLKREGKTEIVSQPAGARVSIDGIFRGLTPLELYLEPGLHLVVFETEWHYPASQMVSIIGALENKIFQELEPYAHLEIQSVPEGATVIFNDQEIGKAPLTLKGLKTGRHHIRIEANGYLPKSQDIFLRPGENRVDLRLDVKQYLLTMESTPAAAVWIGNREVGITPIEVEAPHGAHLIHLKSGTLEWMTWVDLFENRLVRVDLTKDTTIQIEILPAGEAFVMHHGNQYPLPHLINTTEGLHTFDIVRAGYPVRRRVYKLNAGTIYHEIINLEGEASLFVVTHPTGASVYWMGELIGQTPLRDVRVRPGSGEIRFVWQRGELKETVTFLDGQTYTLSRELPGHTKLIIDSFPSGLRVYLNGQEVGITPMQIEVRSGTHEIEVRGPDMERQVQTVNLTGEMQRKVNFVF